MSYSRKLLLDRNGHGFRPGLNRLIVGLASWTLGNRVRLPIFGDLSDHVGQMRELWFAELEALDGSSSGRVLWRVFWRAPSLVIDAALLRLRYSIAHPGNGRTPVSNAIDETERMDGPGGAGRPRTLHRQILCARASYVDFRHCSGHNTRPVPCVRVGARAPAEEATSQRS